MGVVAEMDPSSNMELVGTVAEDTWSPAAGVADGGALMAA